MPTLKESLQRSAASAQEREAAKAERSRAAKLGVAKKRGHEEAEKIIGWLPAAMKKAAKAGKMQIDAMTLYGSDWEAQCKIELGQWCRENGLRYEYETGRNGFSSNCDGYYAGTDHFVVTWRDK